MASAIGAVLLSLYGFYNAIFQPVLALGPYLALGFFSASLAAIFSLIYWHFLDIEKQDELKEKISDYQDKMKEARKNDEADKASDHMQKTMKLNQQMMMLNLKPMIATMLFVALIFPWLGATFAPSEKVVTTGNNSFEGNLTYGSGSEPFMVTNSTNTTIEINDQETQIGGEIDAHGITWDVTDFKDKNGGFLSTKEGTVIKFNAKFVNLPFSIPLAGDALNWLGFYILIAMPLTFIFRKMLGVA